MNNNIYIRSTLKITLGAIALLSLFQFSAQTIANQTECRDVTCRVSSNQPEIHLRLNLNKRRVYIYQGNKLRASYPVAIGKPGWETPTGNFKVIEMLKNPGWTNFKTGAVTPPGTNNPLGERWIGFWTDGKDEIGFHGTPNRASVGKAVSHGCVRMYNEDVRKMYDLVKLGTPVIVESK